MTTSPALGVLLHAIGGFAAGSFYAPLKNVERWAWESFWLVMGLAAWLAAPWIVALITIPELLSVLADSPGRAWGLCLLFGMLWGLGNLTFGLSVRYLGMALGYSVALGFCMVVGTLMPPLVEGRIVSILSTSGGLTISGGVITCLGGIGLCGWAGISKESELTEEQKQQTVAEFALGKGFAVAAMAGVLSACFAFGLASGKPIAEAAIARGGDPLFSNNASLVVILIGGLVSNAVWCLYLNYRHRSFKDYVTGPRSRQLRNYLLAALAGVIWYGQFFFYGMGTTKLGDTYDFSSWSIHMAFIIVFSNLWGIAFHEWRGTSAKTRKLVWSGILTLIISTIVIGYGNYLSA
jgi:L-rhamnose-H+ transport protein